MSLNSLIAHGGKIVVIGGKMNEAWRKYEQDPRVVFWTGDRAEIERNIGKGPNSLPSNTHGIILSRFLGHATSSKFIEEARRRRLVIMGPKNDGEVTRLLQEIFDQPKPAKEPTPMNASASTPAAAPKAEPKGDLRKMKRGEMNPYILNYDDATKGIKEMAEKIAEKMRADGIDANVASLQHAMSDFRRKLGIRARSPKGEKKTSVKKVKAAVLPPVKAEPVAAVTTSSVPVPVMPKSPDEGADTILKMIDDLMAGIGLLRETFIEMRQQTSAFRTLEEALKQLGFTRK